MAQTSSDLLDELLAIPQEVEWLELKWTVPTEDWKPTSHHVVEPAAKTESGIYV
ncbi:hypothetical protein BH11CYA1_BH11CYA1_45700 [soil metagenome]